MNVAAELAFDHAWTRVAHLHGLGILTDEDLTVLASQAKEVTGAQISVLKAVVNRLDKCGQKSDV